MAHPAFRGCKPANSKRLLWAALLLLVSWMSAGEVRAQSYPDGFLEETRVSGLSLPVSFRFLPDGRVLVAEQKSARIRLIDGTGLSLTDPILTVPNVLSSGQEQGLLSIAIDPAWPARNFVYAYYDHIDGRLRLTRYTASGDLDGSGSGEITLGSASALHLIVDIPDDRSNHNGGDLRFAPDGHLLLSVGDDEDKCAVPEHGTYLGKILRLRVDGLSAGATGIAALADLAPISGNPFGGEGDVAALVWALGLRNPFRMHVDPQDGSVFVADVGWSSFEEVSHTAVAGTNFGWPYYEANLRHNQNTSPLLEFCPEPLGLVWLGPIDAYTHSGQGALSVMSAGIYRTPGSASSAWPAEYEGDYFYAEYYQGWIRRLQGSGQSWSVATPAPGQGDANNWATGLNNPVDFAVGADGSLYYLSQSVDFQANSGSLRRIVYDTGTLNPDGSVGRFKTRWRQQGGGSR